MTEFLYTVANHYFKPLLLSGKGASANLELTDWLFIFPSRRAGMFFCKYLCDLNDNKPLLAPRCQTIGDLFGLFSDYRVATRTELLFRLYKVYNKVRTKGNATVEAERFEDFIFWGEMILRDFDEADKYLVPADKLFHNIRDLKRIDEELGGLDEKTIEIVKSFWRNVSADDLKPGKAKESFTQTWAILYEVYSLFRQELRKERLAYEGMRQRDVAECLGMSDMSERLKQLPSHIVLVGITAINEAERQLLKWLQKQGVLECCWDYASEQVQGLPFVQDNLTDFPNALSVKECRMGIVPVAEQKMSRMAVSSGTGQAAEAAYVLQQWSTEDLIHTAVVLPDEHLLDSMLYHLPEEYTDYNVTMGYALKSTPVASLVESLIFLQNNMREASHGRVTYYYKAVLPLLSHSFMLALAMDDCVALSREINKQSLYQVPQEMLQGNELLQLIFRYDKPLPYLKSVLQYFLQAFKPQEGEEQDDPLAENAPDRHILNRECLIAYLQVLDDTEAQMQDAGMSHLDDMAQYHLVRRLAQSQSVSFSGEPMRGLQIMGVLETRAIDFDRIVVLSMNEGVVPAKPSHNSFIPHSLRQAFGLPTQIYKDQIFAYHFYRLISRAHELVFLYDSRTDGLQTGEQSRYLMQLELLYRAKIAQMQMHSAIIKTEVPVVEIPKTPDIVSSLDRFRAGGDLFLSATNLKTYISCPLQFYLAHVRQLSTDDEMEEEMDDAVFGDILHGALRAFYEQMEGKTVMADVLHRAIDNNEYISRLVQEEYQRHYKCKPESGYQQLVCSLILTNVKSILKHDCSVTPFHYLIGEGKCTLQYRINDSLTVNLKAVYDRLDIVRRQDGTSTLRVVDYKTGNPDGKVQTGPIDQIFAQDSKCSREAFQVLLYCLMLEYLDDNERDRLHLLPLTPDNVYQHLSPNLYFSRQFLNENEESHTQVLEGEDDFELSRKEVEQQMKQLIEQIFDPTIPFRQTENEKNCKFCKFIAICNKNINDE